MEIHNAYMYLNIFYPQRSYIKDYFSQSYIQVFANFKYAGKRFTDIMIFHIPWDTLRLVRYISTLNDNVSIHLPLIYRGWIWHQRLPAPPLPRHSYYYQWSKASLCIDHRGSMFRISTSQSVSHQTRLVNPNNSVDVGTRTTYFWPI